MSLALRKMGGAPGLVRGATVALFPPEEVFGVDDIYCWPTYASFLALAISSMSVLFQVQAP